MYCFGVCVFFSSRRRHTRCALVTGVQTCALPIWRGPLRLRPIVGDHAAVEGADMPRHGSAPAVIAAIENHASERRGVGDALVIVDGDALGGGIDRKSVV